MSLFHRKEEELTESELDQEMSEEQTQTVISETDGGLIDAGSADVSAEGPDDAMPPDEEVKADADYRHRDQVYAPPTWLQQALSVARLELRLTYKSNRTLVPIFALAVMAALVLSGATDYILNMFYGFKALDETYGATYTALVLFLLPMAAYYHSAHTARSVPIDFDENLIYIYLTQPVSRSASYIGKYVAGIVPMFVITVMAYLMAAAVTVGKGGVSTGVMLRSMGICILSETAMAATVMSMSAGKGKGGIFKGFLFLFALFPLLYLLLDNIGNVLTMFDASTETAEEIQDLFSGLTSYIFYVPVFGPDIALLVMDGCGISSSFFGLTTLFGSLFTESNAIYGYTSGIRIGVLCIVYVLWTALFLRNGIRKYSRREIKSEPEKSQ